ncbi:hypothetical protein [Chryseobacterium sp.]|uniref:hypothetical protein n=1 Tax=Chryseobacterium sp. TaxID=1871047 RepID=UPI00289CBF93|nr:hypothetical protein [Chryseobacterium sp.]
MATRQTAEAKIDAIQDKGNNTAQEVRDVLTEILNYTENKPFPAIPEIDSFHFWTEKNPVYDRFQNSLHYSVKGFAKQFINLTFRIEIFTPSAAGSNISDNVFEFPLDEKHIKYLKYLQDIIVPLNTINVSFIIPYRYSNDKQIIDHPLSVSIYFTEKTIVFDFNNVKNANNSKEELVISRGSSYTSVTWHYPPFNLGKV